MGFFFSNFMMTMFIHLSIFVGFNLLEPNVESWSFFEVFKKKLLPTQEVKHLYSEIKFVTIILRKTLEGNLQHKHNQKKH
jgi:hypothetical protein